MRAPHPRYRLYTSWRSYLPFAIDLIRIEEDGDAVRRFEEALTAFLGTDRVATLPMCRTGIYLTVKHLVRPGQEVVMSPYTIADVINMVILAGGRPVFADIERETCNISAASVRSLVHAGTGAVLVTHLHGIPAPIREIRDLCEELGVPVIEDAAQAFGARVDGERLGTIGDAGVYSFGTYKNINAWYGGAVTCRNPETFAAIRGELSRSSPQSGAFLIKRMLKGLVTDLATNPILFRALTYWIIRFGQLHEIRAINRFVEEERDLNRRDRVPAEYLGRMTAAQHRLCLTQLGHVDRDNRSRAEKAALYRSGLQETYAFFFFNDTATTEIYTYFPIQRGDSLEERRLLLRFLAQHGCDVGPQHLKNCADLPAFREFHRDCPNARKTAASVVLLPSYPAYPVGDIERNLALLRRYRPD
jgi:dTDP-4-amino-4,6-dideoxygalactose transaminase